jgi:multiple sugar transport system substrate-binding protein
VAATGPVALLAACAGSTAGSGETRPAATLQPVTLEVWMNPDLPQFKDQAEAFERQAPRVTVNAVAGGNLTKLQAALAGGTPPDVGTAIIADQPTLGPKGLAEPVSRALKGQRGWSPEGFLPGLTAAHTFKGELIAAPYIVNSTPILINLDLLDRAGLRLPAPGWSWDQLTEYAVKLTVHSADTTTQWGYATAYTGDFTASNDFNTLLHSYGGAWTDSAGEKAAFNGSEGQAALAWMVDLVRSKRAAPLPWPDEWASTTAPMGRGRGFANGGSGGVAMIPSESGELKSVQRAAGFRWQAVVPPRKTRAASHSSSGSWYIAKGAPHRAAAVEWVRFACLPDELARFAVTSGSLPPHEAAVARPEWQDYLRSNPVYQPYLETARGAVTYPPVPGWAEARAVLATAIGDALLGKVTPRDGLAEAARQADVLFAQARV